MKINDFSWFLLELVSNHFEIFYLHKNVSAESHLQVCNLFTFTLVIRVVA